MRTKSSWSLTSLRAFKQPLKAESVIRRGPGERGVRAQRAALGTPFLQTPPTEPRRGCCLYHLTFTPA